MDIIYESAKNFMGLVNTEYHFVFVKNRKAFDITLDFFSADYRHASGLHYVTDIVIECNPIKVMDDILYGDSRKITDEKLGESKKYVEISGYSGSVKERVSDMRFLEKCLDTSDFMRIYKAQNFGSQIEAEYYIEAYCEEIKSNVYIFIRRREESEKYVVVSFFRKKAIFIGESTYWMLKEKIEGTSVLELYRHPNYKN